ncbi:acyl-CoA N-acyltransferase [Naematelia encephala]|uniref:histone acetyltransferase n=1 Tax=Naematelia encephala TaxID=71784 RepID=A0A1Y2APY6_9TREE|nr:acyl-CoA N-acyltransferase [Naematelia encephala]
MMSDPARSSQATVKQEQAGTKWVIGAQYLVARPGAPPRVAVLQNVRTSRTNETEVYVNFLGEDKRLDSWLGEECVVGIGSNGEGSSKRRKVNDGLVSFIDGRSEGSSSAASTPEREHEAMTRVRNFEDVRFGEYLIKTWYYSPYPMPMDDLPTTTSTTPKVNGDSGSKKRKSLQGSVSTISSNGESNHHTEGLGRKARSVPEMLASGVGKGAERARGRLWACDLCFKYMRTRAAWDRHCATCDMLLPPGRRVYQRGSYTIWEVDGSQAPLYCQNLSLFGKLFIDHKSVFFHVENFLFYVLCDASTSRRDQVMAFFSKEKLSYDDYNLACIVTFPPFQNRGFGKLLIEFSYYLTKHPSTRLPSKSPGTPERPLSDLGLKGYTTYWMSVVLRVLHGLLKDTVPLDIVAATPKKEGRSMRVRARHGQTEPEIIRIEGIEVYKTPDVAYTGQYSVHLSLALLAKACHLRTDDVAFTLTELGFLIHRRDLSTTEIAGSARLFEAPPDPEIKEISAAGEQGEWAGVEVVVDRGMVEEQWKLWRVREKGVLDEQYILL